MPNGSKVLQALATVFNGSFHWLVRLLGFYTNETHSTFVLWKGAQILPDVGSTYELYFTVSIQHSAKVTPIKMGCAWIIPMKTYWNWYVIKIKCSRMMYKNKGDVSSIDETESDVKLYGVQCRYNAIQYNMILHKSLRWLWQNVDEGLNPQRHPISRPNGRAMGRLLWGSWRNLTKL